MLTYHQVAKVSNDPSGQKVARQSHRDSHSCRFLGRRESVLPPPADVTVDLVRPGKSNVLRSGPIVAFSEGLRTKAGRRRNATRAFVLIPNDSMRERLAYLCSTSSPRGMGRSSPTQAAVR